MAYLITGGGGFIGSHLAEALLLRGEQVRILDNWSTGRRQNLAGLQAFIASKQLEVVEGDVRDLRLLERSLQGIQAVFHQAALPSVPRSVADPRESHEVNCTGTLNVLTACREQGVRRVVYAGSSSAYGDAVKLPQEEGAPPAPLSPYAASKLAGEYYCRAFSRVFGLETVVLRYFNVFGPRQDPASEYAAVIPRFISRLVRGEPPIIYGDGEQSRDFSYVDNVVEGNLLALEVRQAQGEVYNIACGEATTVNQLARLLGEIMNVQRKPRFEEARPGDIRHSQADIGRARRLLGYRVKVGIRAGLERTVDYFLREEGKENKAP